MPIYVKNVTLKMLKSFSGSLAFCTRALPASHAFSRRLYSAWSWKSKETLPFFTYTKNGKWYFLHININITARLTFLKMSGYLLRFYIFLQIAFVVKFSGVVNISAKKKMNYLGWSLSWKRTGILKDVTYLELIPVALAIYLWGSEVFGKKVILNSDNQSVVSILISRTTKSPRVMSLFGALFIYQYLAICILNIAYSWLKKSSLLIQFLVKIFRHSEI